MKLVPSDALYNDGRKREITKPQTEPKGGRTWSRTATKLIHPPANLHLLPRRTFAPSVKSRGSGPWHSNPHPFPFLYCQLRLDPMALLHMFSLSQKPRHRRHVMSSWRNNSKSSSGRGKNDRGNPCTSCAHLFG